MMMITIFDKLVTLTDKFNAC